MLFLVGCSASTLIMSSYKGKDITNVILDYGEPSNIIEVSENKRIYQWGMRINRHRPATSQTSGTVSAHSRNQATINTTTQHYGGYTSTNDCIYNLFAEKNIKTGGWFVTDYRKPRIGC